LFDSDLTSLGVGSVKTTLTGQSELVLSFFIPHDAVIGSADIYVNIFTDWPSNGGTPLTRESSANVLIDQSSTGPITPAPAPTPPTQSKSITVIIPVGTAIPGCEEFNACYEPSLVTASIGTTITWENTDNAPHTVTSGNPNDGPDGIFDSDLLMAGASFEVTFNDAGSYDYFCMVHPWMEGDVIIN